MAVAVLAYILVCLLTGFCGTHRRMGFWGTFLLALLTTPLVVLPVLFITGASNGVAATQSNCRQAHPSFSRRRRVLNVGRATEH